MVCYKEPSGKASLESVCKRVSSFKNPFAGLSPSISYHVDHLVPLRTLISPRNMDSRMIMILHTKLTNKVNIKNRMSKFRQQQ